MAFSSTYKEETRTIPRCCLSCGHYMPQFFRIIGRKECAMFTTVDGVKNDCCGAWEPRCDPPK